VRKVNLVNPSRNLVNNITQSQGGNAVCRSASSMDIVMLLLLG
jgi:hypothetical protein